MIVFSTHAKLVICVVILTFSSIVYLVSDAHFKRYLDLIPESFQPDRAPPENAAVQQARNGGWKDSLNLKQFNTQELAKIDACRRGGLCPGNQSKLILLGWGHFGGVLAGAMQGESVWCDALMDVLHALGYTMLFPENTSRLLSLYREYSKNVHMIFWQDEPWHGSPCYHDPTCVYLDTDPSNPIPPPNSTHVNIPIWKIFNMNWWPGASYPLRGPFTLAPEAYFLFPPWSSQGQNNTYIGYSLEKTCLKTPSYPHSHRPRQAYVFAKKLHLFLQPDYILPSPSGNRTQQITDDFYLRMSEELDMSFIGQFKQGNVPEGTPFPPGIAQVPHMKRPGFQKMIAQSRVLIGIGAPGLSPSPWEALCLGVPFIHPIKSWDQAHPDDRTRWQGQHNAMIHYELDEPYVYHVKIGDREGLKRAIRKAMETPIERYIPQNMKMSAMVERVRTLLETDWRPVAREQILKTGYNPGN